MTPNSGGAFSNPLSAFSKFNGCSMTGIVPLDESSISVSIPRDWICGLSIASSTSWVGGYACVCDIVAQYVVFLRAGCGRETSLVYVQSGPSFVA